MIEISLYELVVALLVGSFAVISLWTVVSRWSHGNAERRGVKQRTICRFCLHAFESERGGGKVVHCPQCGAANIRGRDRRLG